MEKLDHVWHTEEAARMFLEDIRGAIPLGAEQISVLLRIVRAATPRIESVLDLGCGDGILGRAVLAEHPEAGAVFLDLSETMIQAAKKAVVADGKRAKFIVQDLGAESWLNAVRHDAPFDLIVSGLAIHHLPNRRKRKLYREIFGLLKPEGLFLNLEQVASKSLWANEAASNLFIDSVWSYHKQRGGGKSCDELAQEFHHRRQTHANTLVSVDLQCRWLKEIGFVDVDCFFKLLETALFGGRKP